MREGVRTRLPPQNADCMREMHVHRAKCKMQDKDDKTLETVAARALMTRLVLSPRSFLRLPHSVSSPLKFFFFNTDLSMAPGLSSALHARHCTFFYPLVPLDGETTP